MLPGPQWRRVFVHMVLEIGPAMDRVCGSTLMTTAHLCT